MSNEQDTPGAGAAAPGCAAAAPAGGGDSAAGEVGATARPWRQESPGYIQDAHGKTIASVLSAKTASLIIRAVNCHDELVAALENIRDRFHRCCVYNGSDEEAATASCAVADAAIAKARGE